MNLTKIAIVFILATFLTLRLADVFSVVPTLFTATVDNITLKADNTITSQYFYTVEKVHPYKFELGNTMISLSEIEVDKPVTINVSVKNIGGEANSYVASLIVNSAISGIRDVTPVTLLLFT